MIYVQDEKNPSFDSFDQSSDTYNTFKLQHSWLLPEADTLATSIKGQVIKGKYNLNTFGKTTCIFIMAPIYLSICSNVQFHYLF